MLGKSLLVIVLPILSVFGCSTLSHKAEPRDQIILVTVKRNDTLNIIAKRHKTNWQDIAMLNREQLTNGLREGQELRVKVPGPTPNSVDTNEMAEYDEDDADDFMPKRGQKYSSGPRSNEPPALVMPAPGRVSSRFGKRGRKLHKGIDIVANVGTPIVASADGEVIFSGRQRGYGSTLVVDHGEFMTLYAHASKLIARSGDIVRRGDFIAKVGRSGNARGAHLHFELRDRDNKPIDPLRYFTSLKAAQSRSDVVIVTRKDPPPVFRAKSNRKISRSSSKQSRVSKAKKRLLYARD